METRIKVILDIEKNVSLILSFIDDIEGVKVHNWKKIKRECE